jgi:hypothetical protein
MPNPGGTSAARPRSSTVFFRFKADAFEKDSVTVRSVIDQVWEDFRLRAALFNEQKAPSTDVLDARTQLSATMTRYDNARYDFQIAVAALDRAMEKPSIDGAEAQ